MSCPYCKYDAKAIVTNEWEIELRNHRLASLNEIGVNDRRNYEYRRERKRYRDLLKKQVADIPRASQKRRVLVTREYGSTLHEYDYGNLVGGCKPLIDVLVGYGVLYDDSPTWLEDHYLQRKSLGRTSALQLTIQEIVL